MKLITVRVVDIYNGMPQRATLSMLQFFMMKKNLLRGLHAEAERENCTCGAYYTQSSPTN